MNPILPAGRTTPVAAYIALRESGVFANVLRVRGVTANNPSGPRNTCGISTPRLGGTTQVTLQAISSF